MAIPWKCTWGSSLRLHVHCITLGRVPPTVTGLLWLLPVQRDHIWWNYRFCCHFKPIHSPSTHFSDDYFLFHACLSCFILLFKKVSWQLSPVSGAVQLSRTFCHLWLPGLSNSSYFVTQSFSLLPHPNKRADPATSKAPFPILPGWIAIALHRGGQI